MGHCWEFKTECPKVSKSLQEGCKVVFLNPLTSETTGLCSAQMVPVPYQPAPSLAV